MCKLLNYFLILSAAAVLGDIPKDITICHFGDNACLTKSTQEVLKKHPGGLRDFNLISFDPLHIKSLVLKRNPKSPVNIELEFKDLDVIGLQNAKVTEVKGFGLKDRTVFEAMVPELSLKGNYIINGNVLILPITGKGESLITCKNLRLKYSFDLKSVEKNGISFVELEHVKLDIKPEHVQFKFDGLFNGDKNLGDNMNKFLNENWSDIYNEMDETVAKALSLVVKQVINNVVSKHPHDHLFPKPV